MKNKILTLTAVGIALLIAACSDCEAERKVMQSKIDSLQRLTSEYDSIVGDFTDIGRSFKGDIKMNEPLPDVPTAALYTKKFRDATSLSIAPAYLFSKKDFANILAHTTNKYVRIYPAVRPGTNEFTLVAVGVDTMNQDDLLTKAPAPDQLKLNVYQFANPCPPCTVPYQTMFKAIKLGDLYPDSTKKRYNFTAAP